jgi:nicotinamidase-related amidase
MLFVNHHEPEVEELHVVLQEGVGSNHYLRLPSRCAQERRPFLRKGDFAPGSRGQANVDLLAPLVDVSVFKVAYSAFFNTQLDWVLKKSGIDTLVVCGIVTNGGVASTVRDAHVRDYHAIVLSDGCAAFSDAAHQAALADMASVGEVMDSATFLKQLG